MRTLSFPSQHIHLQVQQRKPTMASTFLFPSHTPFVKAKQNSSHNPSFVSVPCRAKRTGDKDKVIDDKVLDELLNKYGKVVYSSDGSGTGNAPASSVSSSLDDDSECLSFAMQLAKVADEVKGEEIRLLYVKPLVYWTRFFIITTAFSNPQINAIGSRMRDIAEKQFGIVAKGDEKPNAWTLIDFGDVVVHIFMPEQRTYYNLEEFYGNAIPIELPFDTTRKSYRSM